MNLMPPTLVSRNKKEINRFIETHKKMYNKTALWKWWQRCFFKLYK